MPFIPPDSSTSNATPSTAAARKARKKRPNPNFISYLERPCPPGSNPSMIGIGLYTHVEGPMGAPPEPLEKCSPGLTRATGNSAMVAPVSEEIHNVWEELRDAVLEDERISGKPEFGLEELKQRYGGLDAPSIPRHRMKLVMRQQQDWPSQEEGEIREGTTSASGRPNTAANGRQPSLGAVMATLSAKGRDMGIGGMVLDRGRTTEVASTTSATFYAPDPRKRGR